MTDYTQRLYFGDVVRNADGVVVAPTSDPDGSDYLDYVAWIEAGNQPDTDDSMPPPAVVVPESVEARQLLTVLDAAGLLDQIEAYVAAQPRVVQINWDRAIYFRRDHELLNQAAALLGMGSDQVDQTFIQAALIP